jgi:type I restriction enzyme M protein
MLSNEIKSKINRLWNLFWSGGLSNPLTAIEQISYLLFMKRLDEEDAKAKRKAEFSEQEFKTIFMRMPSAKEKEADPSMPDSVLCDEFRWSNF